MDQECWTCHHPAVLHALDEREADLPLVLQAAPCTAAIGPPSARLVCDCRDYDGMDHPDRPSLSEAWIYRDDDGGVGVV